MKLWLDDLRPAPDGWLHVATATGAIQALQNAKITHVSLDHDLGDGPECGNGYDVACWIEEHAALGTLSRITWAIHSANPVGHARMRSALMNADKYWGVPTSNRYLGR